MMDPERIELPTSALEADIIPFNYGSFACCISISNL